MILLLLGSFLPVQVKSLSQPLGSISNAASSRKSFLTFSGVGDGCVCVNSVQGVSPTSFTAEKLFFFLPFFHAQWVDSHGILVSARVQWGFWGSPARKMGSSSKKPVGRSFAGFSEAHHALPLGSYCWALLRSFQSHVTL